MKYKLLISGILMMILSQSAITYAQDTSVSSPENQQHALFTQTLSQYVDSKGFVNYDGLCQDNRLDQYTRYLSNTDWRRFNRKDQLAFWINVYNSFTLKVICDNYPVDSIKDLNRGGSIFSSIFNSTIWDQEFFEINGKPLSLGYIEHEILRKGPEKARIHFAIVCAAKSCPPLRGEAYEGFKINEQLDEQGFVFLGRKDLNSFDPASRRANLSMIFKWFQKDFAGNPRGLLSYLSRYAPSEKTADLLRDDPQSWKIRWNEYDWSLNNSAQRR